MSLISKLAVAAVCAATARAEALPGTSTAAVVATASDPAPASTFMGKKSLLTMRLETKADSGSDAAARALKSGKTSNADTSTDTLTTITVTEAAEAVATGDNESLTDSTSDIVVTDESETTAPFEEDEDNVVDHTTDEVNSFLRDELIEGINNRWLIVGSSVVLFLLIASCCFCRRG